MTGLHNGHAPARDNIPHYPTYLRDEDVTMAEVLRDDPGSTGMVTAVSGILTKQGVTLFSTEPGPGFRFADVSAGTAERLREVEVVEEAAGPAVVASYTVVFEGERPARTIFVCDLEDGRRTIAISEDTDLGQEATREEFCGRPGRIDGAGGLEVLG